MRDSHILFSGKGGCPSSVGARGRPGLSPLTCDSNDLQVSTPARSHCRRRRFSIMICPNRSSMFTWEGRDGAGHHHRGRCFLNSKIKQQQLVSSQSELIIPSAGHGILSVVPRDHKRGEPLEGQLGRNHSLQTLSPGPPLPATSPMHSLTPYAKMPEHLLQH